MTDKCEKCGGNGEYCDRCDMPMDACECMDEAEFVMCEHCHGTGKQPKEAKDNGA